MYYGGACADAARNYMLSRASSNTTEVTSGTPFPSSLVDVASERRETAVP